MATYSLNVAGHIKARNLDSARKKTDALVTKLKKAGLDVSHTHLKGEK